MAQSVRVLPGGKKQNYFQRLKVDLYKNRWAYSMLIPVIAFYAIFCYGPIGGATIAFRDFSPKLGVWGSPWIGFDNFVEFFSGRQAFRVIRNTILINVYNLLIGFPAPILLAVLLDEMGNQGYKRVVQTITYLPHFISIVIIAGLVKDFCRREGVFNSMISFFDSNYKAVDLLSKPENFRTIIVASDLWQGVGWGSIIYLAALSAVDQELFEAVTIDGGNRWHKIWYVSLPSIRPTIILLLIMRVGSLMNYGYEKIILLYSPSTYETGDVISSYTYRRGILDNSPSFASAVGLFNSAINFVLVVTTNYVSRWLTESSLF